MVFGYQEYFYVRLLMAFGFVDYLSAAAARQGQGQRIG
jgi:hypothetical protein